jgi:EF-hand domain pair
MVTQRRTTAAAIGATSAAAIMTYCIVCVIVTMTATSSVVMAQNAEQPYAPSGDLLSIMEWGQGSDDVNLEAELKPNVFTLDSVSKEDPDMGAYPKAFAESEIKANSEPTTFKNREAFEAAELGASIVRAYQSTLDPVGSGIPSPLAAYLKHIRSNPKFIQKIQRIFTLLDSDGDGVLSDEELHSAFRKHYISAIGIRAMKTWDINYSKHISWQEFKFGPLFLVLLQTNDQVLREFRKNAPGNADIATRMFTEAMGSYFRSNPVSMGLVETQSTELPSSESNSLLEERTMSRSQAALQARLSALHELGLDIAVATATVAKSTATPKSKSNKVVNKKAGKRQAPAANKKTAAPQPGAAGAAAGRGGEGAEEVQWRPKSQFGVPSALDEKCVLCQYVYQRVEFELKAKVVDDYTIFDSYPKQTDQSGGFPGIAQVTGRVTGARQNEVQLIDERGQRTPRRMIREVSQVVMRQICGESAPDLFKAHCEDAWNARDEMALSLMKREPSGTGCIAAGLCAESTYLFGDSAVHYAAASNRLNGARGKAGFAGGAK